ncbi:MAG: RNA-binding protein [Actinobacteria bacterium]|nr:RNA-binding protein [Actinomycetota bacterium]
MKIYAGNLSYSTTSEDLMAAFGQFGTVDSADVITDRNTGRSKGFGFVEMDNVDEAKAAIEGLNGKDIDGRNVNVNEARPREERPQRSSFRR